MPGASPPAVVLGGDSNALSAARTLARAGITVHAIGARRSPVRYSRHIAGYGDLGIGQEARDRWLDWLLDARLGAVLIPCNDDALDVIARNRAALEEHGYVLPEIDDELALAMLDKERTYELAREAGIAVPRTLVPSSLDRVEDAAEILGLPCALKPRWTRARMPEGFAAKAFVVRTAAELAHIHGELARRGVELIATEIVPGSDDRLTQYWSHRRADGEIILELTKHKLRQQPPHFGTGCCQPIAWDEKLAEQGRRFVTGIGLVGFSSVEFKRHPSDGRLMLIECNYRLIDSNEAGRVAGLDVARVVYDRALGRDVGRQPRPRDGVVFWHPVRDLRARVAYRRAGERTPGVRRFARRVTPYFSPDDPRPSVMVAVGRLRRLTARRTAPAAGHGGGPA